MSWFGCFNQVFGRSLNKEQWVFHLGNTCLCLNSCSFIFSPALVFLFKQLLLYCSNTVFFSGYQTILFIVSHPCAVWKKKKKKKSVMTPDNFLKSSRSQVKQPLLKNRPFLPAIASSKILGGWQRSTSCLRVFPSCGMQLPAPDPPAARQRCGASDAEWPGTAEGPGMQRDRGPRDRCRCAVPSEPPGGETGLCCPRPAAAPALMLPMPGAASDLPTQLCRMQRNPPPLSVAYFASCFSQSD